MSGSSSLPMQDLPGTTIGIKSELFAFAVPSQYCVKLMNSWKGLIV